MKGHQHLIDMRRAGRKLQYVWVSDFAGCPIDGSTVCIAGDSPELEDFRFLIGITVLAESSDLSRIKRIVKACSAAKAARVVASLFSPATCEVVQVIDTDGVMTWPN